jgi:predicted 3-demethylubiquinone-9 3-methyltransferase (glyoxalase superfamily)
MQKITPFLWFENQAEEAAQFYTSIFPSSKLADVARYSDEAGPGPQDNVVIVSFQLAGQDFTALNGGPFFQFTPAISFYVACDSEAEVDQLWRQLSEGGSVLMPLQNYPFSEKFGWLKDRYGVSWQLNLGSRPQKITPFLMFVGQQHGKAEEAMNFYTSLFQDSRVIHAERYGADEGEPEGTLKHGLFSLHGQEFMAIDSGLDHQFTFNEAISLYVNCDGQAEVDRLWEALTEGGQEQQCGWLKDRYGVVWQIIPSALIDLMNDPDPDKAQRVNQAMLQMVKIDIEGLQKAYQGR